MPSAEVSVDAALVRALLRERAPQWVDRPLTEVARGWDNAVYRLGEDLAIRVPLRSVAAPLIDTEARWLPVLAPLLPVPTPVPLLVGEPACGYPWRWAVVPWIEGRVLAEVPVPDRTAYAAALAETLVALHRPAPRDAPRNPFRGIPLLERGRTTPTDWVALAVAHGPDVAEPMAAAWERGFTAPAWPGPPLWLHGDPHPLNLLVAGARLAGLIDFGDVTAGDPASDLATAWLTFDPVGREVFVAAVDDAGIVDVAVWDRAAAWAAVIAAALLSNHRPGEALHQVATHAGAQLAGR